MKILFLGDSITQGAGATLEEYRYVDQVAKKCGIKALNYGLSGTRIGRQTKASDNTLLDLDFRLRLTVAERDCDFIFIFGGTNDYGHGNLHLGDVNSQSENTFSGQLKLLINDLIKYYKKEKICFILPMQRYDEDGVFCKGKNSDEQGEPLIAYVNLMRKILQENGIDFIDLYKYEQFKPTSQSGGEYMADNVHPNDKGHTLISNIICEYLNKKIKK